ncbi:hypothetical protein [Novosphingobium profundi]|uniref:hypothetical protein n=1 Tax=Novosphingobium profundi TaxID=1774954 RepID=UPI001CFDC5BC|nr:hypothetical protein [Novosphingobium profundi]
MSSLMFGVLLAIATFAWFLYVLPPGCAMNTTGCRERFDVLSSVDLLHFRTPLALAFGAFSTARDAAEQPPLQFTIERIGPPAEQRGDSTRRLQ